MAISRRARDRNPTNILYHSKVKSEHQVTSKIWREINRTRPSSTGAIKVTEQLRKKVGIPTFQTIELNIVVDIRLVGC